MSIIGMALAFFTPHNCVGCLSEGSLLCANCAQSLRPLLPSCHICGASNRESITCQPCLRQQSAPLYRLVAAAPYEGAAKRLVGQLKFAGARPAAKSMVALLPPAPYPRAAIVTHVPTASSRVRQRGFDQAVLIAKAFARRNNLAYVPCLARHGQQHQVGSSRADRMRHLAGAYRVTHQKRIAGAHIIIVDDVYTTGATLHSAAAALYAAGARTVEGVVFAKTA